MIEIFIAILAFVGVAVGAAIAGTWRRSEHRADTIRTAFTDSNKAFTEFITAVSAIVNYLGAEQLQGRLHEFQRIEFRDATRKVDATAMSAIAGLAVLQVVEPSVIDQSETLAESLADAAIECRNVVGWRPHPSAPAEANASESIIQGDISPEKLAERIGKQLRQLSDNLDALGAKIGASYTRSFRGTQLLNWALIVAIVATIASIVWIAPTLAWKVHVQGDRIVWTNAFTQEVRLDLVAPGPDAVGSESEANAQSMPSDESQKTAVQSPPEVAAEPDNGHGEAVETTETPE